MSEQQSSTNGALTITEALAEIKTLGKRIDKKRMNLRPYLARVENMKDPITEEGGSVEFIKREVQAINDMEQRIIDLRMGIANANATTQLTILGRTQTIAEWLIWRREVAPGQQGFLSMLQNALETVRSQAQTKGAQVIGVGAAVSSDTKPTDIVVNISESQLMADMDELTDILGQLDGMLSLKNATTTI